MSVHDRDSGKPFFDSNLWKIRKTAIAFRPSAPSRSQSLNIRVTTKKTARCYSGNPIYMFDSCRYGTCRTHHCRKATLKLRTLACLLVCAPPIDAHKYPVQNVRAYLVCTCRCCRSQPWADAAILRMPFSSEAAARKALDDCWARLTLAGKNFARPAEVDKKLKAWRYY